MGLDGLKKNPKKNKYNDITVWFCREVRDF